VMDPMKRSWLLVAYDLVFIHDPFSSPRTYSGCGIKAEKFIPRAQERPTQRRFAP
jgi:hypothetical protein